MLGALEAIETLNDLGIESERPVALVNWTNEEGVRFEPAMTCSGVAADDSPVEEIYAKTDRDGLALTMSCAGSATSETAANRPLPAAAYIEPHIEQGPVLEAAGMCRWESSAASSASPGVK